MPLKSMVGPADQRVSFVELFFDLVFVFAVTQVVGLMDDGITWTSVGRAVLVFWLVWWAWTQFAWALNAGDTTHGAVAVATLLATAVAFFMAAALPQAFDAREVWFAGPYVLVRVIGLSIYALVAFSNPERRAAVRTFSLFSIAGMVAVLAGAGLGGDAQYWLWGLAILLDVFAALVSGQSEGWDLHTEHFVERYGLFVIIALGESLIVAAGALTDANWSLELLLVAVLSVALTFEFWLSTFP